MYYQIEGRLNMKTLTFDEEGLTVGKQTYPIDDIENLKITNAPLFATYGILTFHSGDRDISVAPGYLGCLPSLRDRQAQKGHP